MKEAFIEVAFQRKSLAQLQSCSDIITTITGLETSLALWDVNVAYYYWSLAEARKRWRCQDCSHIIEKGDAHWQITVSTRPVSVTLRKCESCKRTAS